MSLFFFRVCTQARARCFLQSVGCFGIPKYCTWLAVSSELELMLSSAWDTQSPHRCLCWQQYYQHMCRRLTWYRASSALMSLQDPAMPTWSHQLWECNLGHCEGLQTPARGVALPLWHSLLLLFLCCCGPMDSSAYDLCVPSAPRREFKIFRFYSLVTRTEQHSSKHLNQILRTLPLSVSNRNHESAAKTACEACGCELTVQQVQYKYPGTTTKGKCKIPSVQINNDEFV